MRALGALGAFNEPNESSQLNGLGGLDLSPHRMASSVADRGIAAARHGAAPSSPIGSARGRLRNVNEQERGPMKAAITDGQGNVWLAETPAPKPNDYQCLCRILACATCTGTDQKHIHNKLPWAQKYPGVLGHESVGKVVSVGAKVKSFAVGDVVLRPTAVYPGERLAGYYSLWGGFAEYGLVTDAPALLADCPTAKPSSYARFHQKLPASVPMSPADATMLITLKETASYVASVGVRLYSSLVILGSGSVAISMCRFAKIFGAYPVIVVGRRDAPLAHARERIGADFTVNVQSEDLVAKVRRLTHGKGVDFVIDATGDVEFLKRSLPVLSDAGKAAAYATYKSP
ncbi:MAG: zinc-binding dehydrogenase, partial [Planctomycetes bacterium]|nr:zinc-binding dehydrogenase [Planctomycetota bacterium]